MIRFFIGSIVAVPAFTLGIFITAFFMPQPLAKPDHDCRTDAAGMPLDPHAVCDVYRPVTGDEPAEDEPAGMEFAHSVCELMKNPGLYTKGAVRVRADLKLHGGESRTLADKTCKEKWVGVSCSAGYAACNDLFRNFATARSMPAEIVAVGTFKPVYSFTGRSPNSAFFEITRINSLKMMSESGIFNEEPMVVRPSTTTVTTGSGSGPVSGSGPYATSQAVTTSGGTSGGLRTGPGIGHGSGNGNGSGEQEKCSH